MSPASHSSIRHPYLIAASGVALLAILALNIAAFTAGAPTPWLLGPVLGADLLAIGLALFVATREALMSEKRSQASRAHLASIVDSAMDAIITVDEKQNIVLFNRAAEQVFRIGRDRVLGTSLDRLLPARFRHGHRAHIGEFGRTGVTSRRMGDTTMLWALRGDSDEEFPIEASISQVSEGSRRYFTVILRDITLRKQAEDAIQRQQQELRELSARVIEAREEEKARIARELHDELGQLLTALKMDLVWLRERLGGERELQARAGEMEAMLDRTVSSTRRISAYLRPLMLDDLGLADAANWLVEDFAHRSGVHCDMQLSSEDGLAALEGRLATAVYRALQESLTNIARHSDAKNAWILLGLDAGRLRLEIEDDGHGMAPGDLAKPGSLGLKGMRERIAHFGGALDVDRAPRGGTRVRLSVPVRAAGAEGAA